MAAKQLGMRAAGVGVAAVLLMMVCGVCGHGSLMDPPQRSVLWRFGYGTPRNYDYNGLFCGGFSTQWTKNGGKCGICGDAYDAPSPRPNEAGGLYAKGIIVRSYQQGQVIDVKVELTANHLGYFVFKLCPNNNVQVEATQECLDSNVLHLVGSNGEDLGTRYPVDSTVGVKYLRLQLPAHITCSQCVLQWLYNAGNSWGCSSTACCVGCGPQENFVNCADVAIVGSGINVASTTTTTTTTTTQAPTTTRRTQAPATPTPSPATTAKPAGLTCQAAGAYKTVANMDNWCSVNCRLGYCPSTHCTCQ